MKTLPTFLHYRFWARDVSTWHNRNFYRTMRSGKLWTIFENSFSNDISTMLQSEAVHAINFNFRYQFSTIRFLMIYQPCFNHSYFLRYNNSLSARFLNTLYVKTSSHKVMNKKYRKKSYEIGKDEIFKIANHLVL